MAIFSHHIGNWILCVRKNFYTEKVVRHWDRLLRAVMESPSLKAFKRCVLVTRLRGEHGGAGLKLEFSNLRVFFSLNNSLIFL